MAIAVVLQRPSQMRPRAMAAAPLVALAAIACCLGGGQQAPSRPESTWRRTRDGWEHLPPISYRGPCEAPFHPLCIATIEAFLTAMALVAYSPPGSGFSPPAPHFAKRINRAKQEAIGVGPRQGYS